MQVQDLQQRKCTIMFELSCNLERILEFFTQELPMAFLQGPEMNLTRLCELIVFVLNHTTCSADALYFDSSVRQQGQSLDKVHRAMILAPLVGIVLNLRSAMSVPNHGRTYDLAHAIVSMDRSAAVISNFQYLISYSWVRIDSMVCFMKIVGELHVIGIFVLVCGTRVEYGFLVLFSTLCELGILLGPAGCHLQR
jgi:Kip1 ubiquitination-promoting complex protein 1